MNNQRRKLYRRLITIGSGIMFFGGILVSVGFESSLFNHWNPLYNSPLLITFAFIFYIARTYVKDKKETTTMLAFVEHTGLADAYDIEPSEESPTHIKYTDERGETVSVKHSHPTLVLPTDDGYERIYIAPRKGRNTINPEYLVKRYGERLSEKQWKILEKLSEEERDKLTDYKFTPEEIEQLRTIPEYEAVSPDLLNKETVETDEPDTLFEEFTHHVAEIRRAVQDLLGARPSLFTLLMYASSGALAMLVLLILGHADFSRVGGG